MHDQKLSGENTRMSVNNEHPKEPLMGETIPGELVTPGEMLIYQAVSNIKFGTDANRCVS